LRETGGKNDLPWLLKTSYAGEDEVVNRGLVTGQWTASGKVFSRGGEWVETWIVFFVEDRRLVGVFSCVGRWMDRLWTEVGDGYHCEGMVRCDVCLLAGIVIKGDDRKCGA